jgi:hypothetical protein
MWLVWDYKGLCFLFEAGGTLIYGFVRGIMMG